MNPPTPPDLAAAEASTSATSVALPLVEERLRIGKTIEETGAVRVRVEVEQHEQTVTLDEVMHQVVVERVPIDRIVEQRLEPWRDGDVTVVPVYAEVAVVERRLLLVEELRLHRRTQRSSVEQQVPLTRQRAVVERRQPDGSWAETALDP